MLCNFFPVRKTGKKRAYTLFIALTPTRKAMTRAQVIVQERVQNFCGWPTDTIALDCDNSPSRPHTLILFLPGNPGLIQFYIPTLTRLLGELGVGYAVRGTSYAGHGLGDVIQHHHQKRDLDIAWTLDGQIQHKLQWIHSVMQEFQASEANITTHYNDHHNEEDVDHDDIRLPNLIFLSHSIGSYLVQQILLLDTCSSHKSNNHTQDVSLYKGIISKKTILIIHLMPFIRFDPEPFQQKLYLTTVSKMPTLSLWTLQQWSRLASILPISWLNYYMSQYEDPFIRNLALELLRQPLFAMHFLKLGLDELSRLPSTYHVRVYCSILSIYPTMVY